MKIKTEDLIGVELDWAVAKCEGVNEEAFMLYYTPTESSDLDTHGYPEFHYSTIWAQGGPIIERERIGIWPSDALKGLWAARPDYEVFPERRPPSYGVTPLIAAMRCYVASKLGDTAEVPDELAPAL